MVNGSDRPTFNKQRSAAFQIRYQVLSVRAPSFGVLFERCEMLGACVDLLVLFYCLRTLLCRIEFSSLSLLLCARSQAVFGGMHPVKTSIYTEGTNQQQQVSHCCLTVCLVRRIKFSLVSRVKFSCKVSLRCMDCLGL